MEDDLGLSFGVIKFQFLAPLVKGVETNRHSIAATAMILNITNLEKQQNHFCHTSVNDFLAVFSLCLGALRHRAYVQ